MQRHELVIQDWHPARLNQFVDKHWAVRSRLKRRDSAIVQAEALVQAVPQATTRRRVSLVVALAKGKPTPDPDAYWKALLDSLVRAGLLKDDNREWCEPGTVEFERSGDKRFWTTIILEDLPPVEAIKPATRA